MKIGDLFQQGAIRVQRSWCKGDINPTKTDENRDVGVDPEILERLMVWIAKLPQGTVEGWAFPSERIVTPLLPDNVLRRCIHPRLVPLGLEWINFANCPQLSDAGLQTLTRLKPLKKLTLTNCTKLTEAAVSGFRKARPDVALER